jgi:hypothetical protein
LQPHIAITARAASIWENFIVFSLYAAQLS